MRRFTKPESDFRFVQFFFIHPVYKLIAFVKPVDIDNIKDFSFDFCQGLEAFEDPISGSYRDLCSYLLVLAELYILIDQALGPESFIRHFGSLPIYHFRIALGLMVLPSVKKTRQQHGSSLL